jgi:hypothetical protein
MSGNPTISPIIELGGSSTNEGCADSDVYRWRSDPVKSCDWMDRNANYVDNLCPQESVALNCPQKGRKWCGDDENFRITTDVRTLNACTWLTNDPNAPFRVDRYCNRMQMGSLIRQSV